MPCGDGVAAKLGKSEQAARIFRFMLLRFELLTDLLHGHETKNTKSHPMLVSRPVKDSLYRYYIRIVVWEVTMPHP